MRSEVTAAIFLVLIPIGALTATNVHAGPLQGPQTFVTCELTRGNGGYLSGSPVPGRPSEFYGNGSTAIGLGSSGLTLVFEPGGPGSVLADGSLQRKLLWAKVRLPMKIDGRRLDAAAPPLRSQVDDTFATENFQPSFLIFPTPGCWEITARVGQSTLTFVVDVVKVGEGPSPASSLQRLERDSESRKHESLADRLRNQLTTEVPPPTK